LVLVPGLYVEPSTSTEGEKAFTGRNTTIEVTNPNTRQYLRRISEKVYASRKTIILVVSSPRSRITNAGPRRFKLDFDKLLVSYVSVFLYALVPLLTIAAIILMILAQDWWGLGIILWLIIAREY